MLLVFFWNFLAALDTNAFNTEEVIEFHEPSYCAADEYFNASQLKCITCNSDENLVPSADGFSCVCNAKSKIIKWDPASFPVCEPCKENEIPTRDQLDCIQCPLDSKENVTNCEGFQCPLNSVLVERAPNGSVSHRLMCVKCNPGTVSSLTHNTCNLCKEALVTGQKHKCICHENETDVHGVCFSSHILVNLLNEKAMYTITYENGKKIYSQFLRDNLLQGILFCKRGNYTSCQLVANMCVIKMYSDDSESGPCSIFRERNRIQAPKADSLPWLYYGEGDAPTVLSRRRISVRFNLDRNSHLNYLNVTGIIYNADGSIKEMKRIMGHSLQLCPASWKNLDASFRFGAKYFHTCDIPAKQVLFGRDTEFIDLFLSYREENKEVLHALPVLVLNLKHEEIYKNKESDRMQWQLVRRIFLVDKLSGFNFEESQSWKKEIPEIVRYAKSVTLNVKLQEREYEGKIFVPFLTIEYGEMTKEEIEKNSLIRISFRVNYEMDNRLSHVLEVLIGVFCGLAVVWSGIRTWSISKRSGRLAIDFATIAQLMLFACGNLANVFFLAALCASSYFFVFFKGQNGIYVLFPSENQEETVKLYLISAFFLKVIDIVQLIYNQITVDIFFIDWERPRARNMIPRKLNSELKNSRSDEEQPVSIWRTYFVANEWNEIQSKRKINNYIHLLVTVFILKVSGIEFWATSDPELHSEMPLQNIGKEFSFIFRFSVGALVYIIVYIVQRFLAGLIYERFIKNGIQEFVDICSMANVSVFILEFENYGYYIHGRSAHGFADTDMQHIINQLLREEEDLVGHRGLLPGTDQQTFEMTVPTQLRAYYRKVMAPLNKMSQISKKITISSTTSGLSKMGSENVNRSVQAYHNMNRFLAAFLEHALKDLDYEVRDKLFTEKLLEIEFVDPSEKGVFYSDNGHSFDNVLFYGNEFSLFTFDIMLFCFVLCLTQDYLVAGIVTATFSYIITIIKDLGGRKNLAKKTLIDERFLI